jgi:nuclease S1
MATFAITGRHTRSMRRASRQRPTRFALFLVILATIAVPRTALAWGRMGHRAAARLTEARLTPEASAAVRALLEPGESLADASTWADGVRRDIPESAPWHYVNVPITEAKYSARFCPPEGCVVEKIADFRRVLADPKTPRSDRRKALRFLIHFIQDLHQPVHVGDRGDRGGNDLQVQFFGHGSNLHRVWDSGLVEHAFSDENALLRALTSLAGGGEAAGWVSGTVEDWAGESLGAARVAYREPGSDRELKRGAKLGESYQSVNLPVANKRLAQSAVRLADVLNGIFAPGR